MSEVEIKTGTMSAFAPIPADCMNLKGKNGSFQNGLAKQDRISALISTSLII